jgi:hypothetical protein
MEREKPGSGVTSVIHGTVPHVWASSSIYQEIKTKVWQPLHALTAILSFIWLLLELPLTMYLEEYKLLCYFGGTEIICNFF